MAAVLLLAGSPAPAAEPVLSMALAAPEDSAGAAEGLERSRLPDDRSVRQLPAPAPLSSIPPQPLGVERPRGSPILVASAGHAEVRPWQGAARLPTVPGWVVEELSPAFRAEGRAASSGALGETSPAGSEISSSSASPPAFAGLNLSEAPPLAYILRATTAGTTREFLGVMGNEMLVDVDEDRSTGLAGLDLRVYVAPDPDARLTVLPPPPSFDGELARALIEMDALEPVGPEANVLMDLEATVHMPLSGFPLAENLPAGDATAGARTFAYLGYRLEPSAGDRIPAQFHVTVGFPAVSLDPDTFGESEQGESATYTVDIETQDNATSRLALLAGSYTAQPAEASDTLPSELGETLRSFEPTDLLAAAVDMEPFPTQSSLALTVASNATEESGSTLVRWSADLEPRLVASLDLVEGLGTSAEEARELDLLMDPMPSTLALDLSSDASSLDVSYQASRVVAEASAALAQRSGSTLEDLVQVMIQDLPQKVDVAVMGGSEPSVDLVASSPIRRAVFARSNQPFTPPAGQHLVFTEDATRSIVSAAVDGLEDFHFAKDDAGLELSYSKSVRGDFTVLYDKDGIEASGTISELPRELAFASDLASGFTYEASETIDFIALDARLEAQGIETSLLLEEVPRRMSASYDGDAGALDFVTDDALGRFFVALTNAGGFEGSGEPPVDTVRVNLVHIPSLSVRWSPDGSRVEARVLDLNESLGLVEVALASGSLLTLPGSHAVYVKSSDKQATSVSFSGFKSFELGVGEGVDLRVRAAEPQPFAARVVNGTVLANLTILDLPYDVHIVSDLNRSLDYQASDPIGLLAMEYRNGTADSLDLLIQDLPTTVRVDLDLPGKRLDFWASDPLGLIAAEVYDPDAETFKNVTATLTSIPSLGINWTTDAEEQLTSFAFSAQNPAAPMGSVEVALAAGEPVALNGNHVYLRSVPGDEALSARVEGLHSVTLELEPHLRAAVVSKSAGAFTLQQETPERNATVNLTSVPSSLALELSTGNVTEFTYESSSGISRMDVNVTEAAGLELGVTVEGIPARVAGRFDPEAGRASFDASEALGGVTVAVRNESGLGDSSPYTQGLITIEDVPPVDIVWSPNGTERAAEVRVRNGSVGKVQVALADGEPTDYDAQYPGDYFVLTNTSIVPDVDDRAEVSLKVTGLQRLAFNLTDALLSAQVKADGARPFDFYVLDKNRSIEGFIHELPSEVRVDTDLKGSLRYRASETIARLAVAGESWKSSFSGFDGPGEFDGSGSGGAEAASGPQRNGTFQVEVAGVPELLDILFDGAARVASFEASSSVQSLDLNLTSAPESGDEIETVSVSVDRLPRSLSVSWDPRAETAVFQTDGDAIAKVEVGISTGEVQNLSNAQAPGHQVVMVDDGDDADGDGEPEWSLYARLLGLREATLSRAGGTLYAKLGLSEKQLNVRVENETLWLDAEMSTTPSTMEFESDLASRFVLTSDAICASMSGATCIGQVFPDLEGSACIGGYNMSVPQCEADKAVFQLTDLPETLDLGFTVLGALSLSSSTSMQRVYVALTHEGSDSLFGKSGLRELSIRLGSLDDLDAPASLEASWANTKDILLEADRAFPVNITILATEAALADYPAADNYFQIYLQDTGVSPINHLYLKLSSVESARFCSGLCDEHVYGITGLPEGESLAVLVKGLSGFDLRVDAAGLPSWLRITADFDGWTGSVWARKLFYEASGSLDRLSIILAVIDSNGNELVITAKAEEIPSELDFVFGNKPNVCDNDTMPQLQVRLSATGKFLLTNLVAKYTDLATDGFKLALTPMTIPSGSPAFRFYYCLKPGDTYLDAIFKWSDAEMPSSFTDAQTFTGVFYYWIVSPGFPDGDLEVYGYFCKAVGEVFYDSLTDLDVQISNPPDEGGFWVNRIGITPAVGGYFDEGDIKLCAQGTNV